MKPSLKQVLVVLGCFLSLAVAAGCRDTMPHSLTWPYGGDVVPSHAKPPEGGYYTDWDPYAATLEVLPVEDVNPVATQHVLVATVRDRDGKPLPNRRVEWIIAEGSVGDIVEVDESGWRASRGYKLTNKYAVSHTNNCSHVLDLGNDDPADDIHLERGQTWCTITSPVEGTTHIIAYAPGIYDWEKHKVFVKKHWFDVGYKLPPDATNRVGTDHVLTTKVMRPSDGSPLANHKVTYRIVSGPEAQFAQGGQTATVLSDAGGLATVTLRQVRPVEGRNEIEISVFRPESAGDAASEAPIHVGTGTVRKTWIAPQIAISKTAPSTALMGERFAYDIIVANPSSIAANNVVVRDVLPDGISYVSSSPEARRSGQELVWQLGSMAGGGRTGLRVMVTGQRKGTFTNPVSVTADDGLSARAEATTRIGAPELTLAKEGPSEMIFCRPWTYTLIVRNTGDAPAMNVRIEDKLPANLLTTKGEQSVSFTLGTIEAGGSKQVQFEVKSTTAGTFRNEAVVSADGGLSASASLATVVRQPVLKIAKTGPAQRFLGKTITYDITVTNTGDSPAENTVVVDSIPPGTTFQQASDGGRHSGGTVTWELGTLAVNASKKLSVTLMADRLGSVRNEVRATAVCAEASAEASTEVVGIPAILLECVDIADPIEVGENETYRITVTNQGSAQDTNIVVTCTLPTEQKFVSADGPTEAKAVGNTVVFEPLKFLAPGDNVVYTVIVQALKAGDVRFAVKLESDQMESPASETESTRLYE